MLRAEKRAADAERRLQQYLGASTELIKPLLRQGKQVQRALAEQSAARGDGSGLWLWCVLSFFLTRIESACASSLAETVSC